MAWEIMMLRTIAGKMESALWAGFHMIGLSQSITRLETSLPIFWTIIVTYLIQFWTMLTCHTWHMEANNERTCNYKRKGWDRKNQYSRIICHAGKRYGDG